MRQTDCGRSALEESVGEVPARDLSPAAHGLASSMKVLQSYGTTFSTLCVESSVTRENAKVSGAPIQLGIIRRRCHLTII